MTDEENMTRRLRDDSVQGLAALGVDMGAFEYRAKATNREIHEAICGAIGWIAATTNEGNNQTSHWTRDRLAQAAQIFAATLPDKAVIDE